MEIERLGVVCTWRSGDPKETSASFGVEEFAFTSDGNRLSLHFDRGWTAGILHSQYAKPPPYWDRPITVQHIISDIHSTLLPEDDGDNHDWLRLVDILESKGITVTRDELYALPYTVELSPNLLEMLPQDEAERFPLEVDWASIE